MLSAWTAIRTFAPRLTRVPFRLNPFILRTLLTLTRQKDAHEGLVRRPYRTRLSFEGVAVTGIAVVELARPEAKNALSLEMLEALRRHTIECAEDQDLRCVVLTSAVPDTFCAGITFRTLSMYPVRLRFSRGGSEGKTSHVRQ